MSYHAVIYDGSQIVGYLGGASEEGIRANVGPGQDYILVDDVVNPDEFYMLKRKLTPKSQFELHYKDTQEVGSLLTIAHVPEGTRVIWPDGEETVETDGIVECELAYVGEYLFEFRHAKFFTTKVTIHVPA